MNDESAIVRNPDAIRDILRVACDRSEIAILVTPYVKFELNFLWLEPDAVHVTATMSREDALYGLKSPQLKVRFPHGHRIFSAATSLLGIGLARGRKSLRLALPSLLESDDFRRAFRVEKVGRVQVTFSSRRYDLLTASLVNISTGGARVFASKELEEGDVQVGDAIHVSIPLAPGIQITGKAKVRHVKDRTIGMEFKPALDGKLLDDLSRWAFKKKEEAIQQFALADRDASGEPGFQDLQGPLIALVGGTPALEERLRPVLAGLPPLRRLPATVQTARVLAGLPGVLAVFLLESADPLAQKRLSLLLEPVRGRIPFVLAGTAIDPATLIRLANDWEALLGVALDAGGTASLQRLAAGLFSK